MTRRRSDYRALQPVLLVFFEGIVALLTILTCPFNVAPLIKKRRRNPLEKAKDAVINPFG